MTWIGGDAAMPQELRFGYGLTIELVISRPYGLRAFQCRTISSLISSPGTLS